MKAQTNWGGTAEDDLSVLRWEVVLFLFGDVCRMHWEGERGLSHTTEMVEEARNLLAALVRADTSNPPGDESPAARVLTDYFDDSGIPYRLFEAEENRTNVYAELEGGPLPPLYLVSHLDVVGAREAPWRHDPFGAEIIDGQMWGRGTVDTKGITAMHAVTAASLARCGRELRRPLVFLATADEERGSTLGMQHLICRHRELFRPGTALTEGGGFSLTVNAQRFYLLDSAQKGRARVHIRASAETDGHQGHAASTPVELVARATVALCRRSLPARLTPTAREMFVRVSEALGIDSAPLGASSGQQEAAVCDVLVACGDPMLGRLLRDASENTFSANYVCGGEDIRRPPREAEVGLGCRLLPGIDRGSLDDLLERRLSGLGVSCCASGFRGGYDAGVDGELLHVCREVIGDLDPAAEVLPFYAIGNTDSRLLYDQGITSYGFAPMKGLSVGQAVERAHGVDERLPLESLEFGLQATLEIARRFCLAQKGKESDTRVTVD